MGEGTATANGEGSDGRSGGRSVSGLRIPADKRAPVTLAVLRLSASALSDAIGGGCLDDALVGEMGGASYTFYLDEHRVAKGLPGNERAAALAVRLGHLNREWPADLRGDVLVLGCDRHLNDTDIPLAVLDAATQAGLLRKQAGQAGER